MSVILTLRVIPAVWVATILTTPWLTSQADWASFLSVPTLPSAVFIGCLLSPGALLLTGSVYYIYQTTKEAAGSNFQYSEMKQIKKTTHR